MDERNAKFNSFIHPSAIIARTSKIGRGCIIFPYSVCSCNSNLSDFITINLHSAVGHDVSIDSFTTVSSFVDLTGKVKVGKEVLIGWSSILAFSNDWRLFSYWCRCNYL